MKTKRPCLQKNIFEFECRHYTICFRVTTEINYDKTSGNSFLFVLPKLVVMDFLFNNTLAENYRVQTLYGCSIEILEEESEDTMFVVS